MFEVVSEIIEKNRFVQQMFCDSCPGSLNLQYWNAIFLAFYLA